MKMRIEPDFIRSMSDGQRAGVIRKIEFNFYNGNVTWDNGQEVVSTTFDDDLDERSMSRRLRTATRPQSNFSRKIVRDAFSRLGTLRRYQQPGAQIIIYTESQEEGRKMQEVIKQETGETLPLAISDNPASSQVLKNAAEGNGIGLITVKMASEGYNNVNAVIAVYLTTITEIAPFTQMITRVVRKPHPKDQGVAYVYAPNDPRLREHARSLNSSVFIVETREDEPDTVLTQGGTKPNGSTFVPLQADVTETDAYFDGLTATNKDLKMVNTFRSAYPDKATDCSDVTLVQVLKAVEYKIPQSDEDESAFQQPRKETYDETVKRYRKRISQKANQLANFLDVEPRDVHRKWINGGGSKHEDAHFDELIAKDQWLNQELLKTSNISV